MSDLPTVEQLERAFKAAEESILNLVEERDEWRDRAESYRLDVAAIRDALEAPEDADINQLIDIVHALTEQVEKAQLPEPDATNPAHLRFCAGLLALISVREGNAMASNHYGYGLPFTGNHLIDLAKHLEAAQQQADTDEELIDRMVEAYFTAAHGNVPKTVYPHVRKGMRAAANLLRDGDHKANDDGEAPFHRGISNGQLLAMAPDRRAEVIASLSLEVRRNLAHIAILGASRLIKESVCDDSHHKARRADEFAELAANLLRDGGEK